MKELTKKQQEIIESLDWGVLDYSDDGRVELENYSPAGEDLIFDFNVENFAESVAETAANFDIDEHIEMWVEARQNGVSGVPSVRELVHDAEEIDKMLQELAAKLASEDC